jgi:hypothetical protein
VPARLPSIKVSWRSLLFSSVSGGFVLTYLLFFGVVALTESDDTKVFWTPEVFGALVSALPAVLIALVLEAGTARPRRMDLDALVAAGVLLGGELVASPH